MRERDKARDLTREFFRAYPDYWFCRTLADNVREQVTTYAEAVQNLARRAEAARTHADQIEEKLSRRTVRVAGGTARLKDLSLSRILELDDAELTEAVRFYFKHPYAHGRTRKSRLLPGWIRTFFLRALLGNAKRRNLDLDYPRCFEILGLL